MKRMHSVNIQSGKIWKDQLYYPQGFLENMTYVVSFRV